jgi:hypothetical protein
MKLPEIYFLVHSLLFAVLSRSYVFPPAALKASLPHKSSLRVYFWGMRTKEEPFLHDHNQVSEFPAPRVAYGPKHQSEPLACEFET